MTSSQVFKQVDPSVSLTLQSLIDERLVLPHHSAHTDIQGLSTLSGQISSRRRGQGLEFEDLRTYTAGDDIRHIDWNVSARHNQLYTRIFREEKEQRVTLALDFTSPMFTGSVELKAIQAGRMAANFAWHLVSLGGRCGLLIQTEKGFHAVQPALGDTAALTICAEIAKQFDIAKADAQTTANVIDKAPQGSAALLERLCKSDRSTGAIIALAGLDNIDAAISLQLKELRIAKQIVVVSIEDPLEYTALPTGLFRYKSAGSNKSIVLNKKQTTQLRQLLDKQNLQITDAFAHAQVPLLQSRIGMSNTKAALNALGFLA